MPPAFQRPLRRRAAGWLTLLALLATGSAAHAHPADEATVAHYAWIELDPGRVRIQLTLILGGVIFPNAWGKMDQDLNRVLSATEQQRVARDLAARTSLSADGRPLTLELTDYDFPEYEEFLLGQDTAIKLLLEADLPAGTGAPILLRLTDRTFPEYQAVYVRAALKANDVDAGPPINRDDGQATEFLVGANALPDDEEGAPPSGDKFYEPLELLPDLMDGKIGGDTTGSSGGPTLGLELNQDPLFPPGSVLYAQPEDEGHDDRTTRLREYLRQPMSLGLILLALAASLIAGAAHALSPGHGKAMVAAYLVGAKGTIRDAVTLGVVVTVTHTSSVFLLGALSIWATHWFSAERLGLWLELGSGVLVLGMGVWLFLRGLLAYYGLAKPVGHRHSQGLSHDHDHHHDDDHVDGEGAAAESKSAGTRAILGLGIAGGMVPCFDALAILVVAVSLGQALLGMVIILAFSVGMALVLVLIGVVMVTARDRLRRFSSDAPWIRILPAASGLFITLLGGWLLISALVHSGYVSIGG